MSYTVYGHYVSQPSRAVLWALSSHNIPFKFEELDPTRGQTRTPEFLKINPGGFVPVLVEAGPGGSFTLSESAAILTYLAEKHQWKVDSFPFSPFLFHFFLFSPTRYLQHLFSL